MPRFCYSCHPLPRLRVTIPPVARDATPPPRPDSTHANFVCAGPGVGWWGLNHPGTLTRATPPQRGTCSAAVRESAAISVVKGNLDCYGIRVSSHIRRKGGQVATGTHQVPLHWRGAAIPGPTKMQFSWVVGAWWLESTELAT